MPYTDILEEINQLKTRIESEGPLPQDILKKVNYKFRLEWNYTSNSMEGNSLTRRETRTVMVGLVGVKDKPIKDVMEIRKHDAVITTIMQIGAGDLNISERRIKDIHQSIMYEEDPEKLKYIGEWKNVDNYLHNFRGERFDFTPHKEVKEKIHELINWLNAEKERMKRGDRRALHPAIIAFEFHIRYLTIHPFYDGNGRTARILSNLILIAFGFPPFYIKEEEKASYYQYLTDIQSYGGEPDLFYEFMAKLLLRSQQMVVNAIEGKELEEPDDIDKEIALLKKQQVLAPQTQRSITAIEYELTHVFYPLLQALDVQLHRFSDLFEEGTWKYFDDSDQVGGGRKIFPVSASLLEMMHHFDKQLFSGSSFNFKASFWFNRYKDQDNEFDIEIAIPVHFHEEYYEMEVLFGMPFESSSVIQGFKQMINTLRSDSKEEYLSIDGSGKRILFKGAYGMNVVTTDTIEDWTRLIAKDLLVLIKHKTNNKK